MIRSTITALLVLLAVHAAPAQTIAGAASSQRELRPFSAPAQHATPHEAAAPTTQTELHYFDPSLATYDWTLGGNYGGIVSLILGERISLPWTNGFIDSVSIVIDSLHGDSVRVILAPDTLFDVGNGVLYHLMDIFGSGDSYAEVVLHREDINFGGETIVRFDHAAVPQQFFVTIAADVDFTAGTVAPAWVRGDREAARTRTAESARSGMVGLFNGQYYSLVLDSTFVPTGETDPLFSNLYVKAYITAPPAAVRPTTDGAQAIALYPNPTTDLLHVHSTAGAATITVYDQLGRTMLVNDLHTGDETVDVRSLANGCYRVVLRDAHGSTATALSIVR